MYLEVFLDDLLCCYLLTLYSEIILVTATVIVLG